ncbi:SRR1-like protein [Erythrolamprus reginae]|uniref:SRR1-like protein n=1 Tax=Erythrolamprus reginae TaxID=121349 RepID=UPI00396C79C7
MSAGWSRAGGGGRRRRRRRAEEAAAGPEAAAERQRRRLQEAITELRGSDFWPCGRGAVWKTLRGPPAAPPASWAEALRCVCYGLGSFASCGKARLQLAFLVLLLEELKVPPERCFVFDPVFSALEVEVLSGLGLTVLQRNEDGKRRVEGPTLFYMIHCGKALYNNLLWRNWSVEALSQMVVVGNSFRALEERLLAKVFSENYSYIAKVLEATQEEALPPHQQHPEAFNDTSVHCFPLQKLRGLPGDLWACHPEPLYPEEAQLEIIRNQPSG